MRANEITDRLDRANAVAETVAAMETHAVPGSRIGYEFGLHVRSDDPDRLVPRDDARFARFLQAHAAEAVERAVETLSRVLDENDGYLCLYRGMIVPADWLDGDLCARGLGQCWSWDYEFATPHRGPAADGQAVEVRIVATVAVQDVDWTATVAIQASEAYLTAEEREVRLLPQAMVSVAAVDRRPAGDEHVAFVPDERYEGIGLEVCAGAPSLRHSGSMSPG